MKDVDCARSNGNPYHPKALGDRPFWPEYKTAALTIPCKIEEMPYISEHLSSLRQEITTLRNMNVLHSEKSEHSPMDQSALELRTIRLREIKQELSKMLDHPHDARVWWEKLRGSRHAA